MDDSRNTVVIHHGGCADGFTSAWVARKLYPNAEFVPVEYSNIIVPDVTDKNVLILDFAYNRTVLKELEEKAYKLQVIDHHVSAMKDLSGLSFCFFDILRSGAGLTWDILIGKERNWLVNYIEDRDLWVWKQPNSREICAAIDSYTFDFDTWDSISVRDPSEFITEGRAILRYRENKVKELIKHPKFISFEDSTVPIINCTNLISDAGAALAIGNAFSITWRFQNGQYLYSLRSSNNGADVSIIAKKYGGGGHKQASGFILNHLLEG